MKLQLDPQIFIEQRFGGISRYFSEIWRIIEGDPNNEIECPLFYSGNIHLRELGKGGVVPYLFIEDKRFKGRDRIISYLKSYSYKYAARKMSRNNFDLFIPTYYSPYFLDVVKKPTVLTVYDMIHELYPGYFKKDTTTVVNKKRLMEKADRIIAISHNTKQDIVRLYPHIDQDKIDVVYLAQSIRDEELLVKINSLPEDYILFVGNRPLYKEFSFMVQAIQDSLLSRPNLKLVCAGGGKFTEPEIAFIRSLGLQDRIVQINYSDHELGAIYKGAHMFIFPSRYEGFGIPVLEAMKCGCPCVLARSSSLPEVAGDNALYFEVGNPADLQNQVERLLTDEGMRSELIEKGLARERTFSWERTAEQCLEVYQKAI